MRNLLAVVTMFVVAGFVAAEPPSVKIKQPDGPITAKALYKFEVTSDASNARFGKVLAGLTQGRDYYADTSGRAIYVVFPKGGAYTLTAYASKSDEIGEDVLPLTVADAPGGGGGDDTAPDEFLKTLTTALNAEPSEVVDSSSGVTYKRSTDVGSLIEAYRVLATSVNDAAMQTPVDIGKLVKSVREKAVGARLRKVQDAIAKDFTKVISGAEDKKLTDMDRVNAGKSFARYADTLQKLK